MKITATMHTRSKIGSQHIGTDIERVAHEFISSEFISSDGLRVVVVVGKHGVTVNTSRKSDVPESERAASGAPEWIDDATIALIANRPTVVTTTPNTEWIPSEPVPF